MRENDDDYDDDGLLVTTKPIVDALPPQLLALGFGIVIEQCLPRPTTLQSSAMACPPK